MSLIGRINNNLKLTTMRKFLRLSLVCLMAMVCGNTFSAEPYKVLTFPDDDSENNKVQAYTETWTAKIGGDSWTITRFNNNNWDGWTYIKCGKKQDSNVASIATDAPIDAAIGNVVVTIDKMTAKHVKSISLVVASDASYSNVVETVNASELAAGEMVFTVTKPTANSYYKVLFDYDNTSTTNGIIQVSKVAYYAEGEGPVIVDISNTPETAYTVAKAHELIEAGEGLATSVYIKGIVTEIDEISTSYGNATYYINDTNTKEGQLCVYRGQYFDGENFTSADELETGDEVIIYGQLSVYSQEHQVAQGSKIYSINGKTEPEAPSVDISNTPETAYTVAEANDLITAGEGLSTKVYVKGVITKIDEVNTSNFGNATYYINDTQTEEGQLYIFRGYYLDGEKFTAEDQIKVGDEVIVYGQLINFNGTYEMKDNQIYSINGVTTGITDITVEKEFDENAPIYNISGQRVDKNAKGILIQNGKKFIRR